jgi:hypothetical protein
MKMTAGDFHALENAIASIQLKDGLSFAGLFRKHLLCGYSSRSFRFNMLYQIPLATREEWFGRGIYEYLDDDNIHTALKKILG